MNNEINELATSQVELEASGAGEQISSYSEDEFGVCHRLQHKAVFVIGYARSSTTITLQIINAAKNALLLGEANCYLRKSEARFRDWYNNQHQQFQNQATKSSYAPDFVPGRSHLWYEWLERAADFYDVIGEKIALSANHFSLMPPNEIQSFYEARFFSSRYVFLIRNPIDTLLSTANLLRIDNEQVLCEQCLAWLSYIQLWADWIRIFPNTLTLIADQFSAYSIDELAAFTGLNLEGAKVLLRPEKVTSHAPGSKFPAIARLESELMTIFNYSVLAVRGDRTLWQAEQKRNLFVLSGHQDAPQLSANAPHELGKAWAAAQELRERLQLQCVAELQLT